MTVSVDGAGTRPKLGNTSSATARGRRMSSQNSGKQCTGSGLEGEKISIRADIKAIFHGDT
jgi:hypothetical protein